MTPGFRLTYAPVRRIDTATDSIPVPLSTYGRTRVVAQVNPSISLEAVDLESFETGAGYLAASYTPDDLPTDFTIRLLPNFADFTTFVPCVSWIVDGVLLRYRLTDIEVGEVPFELYAGQVIDKDSATIELWARGDNDTLVLDDWEIVIGLVEIPGSTSTFTGQVYTSTLCVAEVTDDADFAAYMTSCSRNPVPPDPPAQVEDVEFSVPSGAFSSTFYLTLTCPTSGASIYFTLDGSDPDTSSFLYTAPVPISVTRTVKAFAVLTGSADSNITSATYTKTIVFAGWISANMSQLPTTWPAGTGIASSGNVSPAGTYDVTGVPTAGTYYFYVGFEIGLSVPTAFSETMYTGYSNIDVNGNYYDIVYTTAFGGTRGFHVYRVLARYPSDDATLIVT